MIYLHTKLFIQQHKEVKQLHTVEVNITQDGLWGLWAHVTLVSPLKVYTVQLFKQAEKRKL